MESKMQALFYREITRLKSDYASGTNHTLPTNGYAKNYSGVNLIVLQNR
jgi:histidinol dehydrogenase